MYDIYYFYNNNLQYILQLISIIITRQYLLIMLINIINTCIIKIKFHNNNNVTT